PQPAAETRRADCSLEEQCIARFKGGTKCQGSRHDTVGSPQQDLHAAKDDGKIVRRLGRGGLLRALAARARHRPAGTTRLAGDSAPRASEALASSAHPNHGASMKNRALEVIWVMPICSALLVSACKGKDGDDKSASAPSSAPPPQASAA